MEAAASVRRLIDRVVSFKGYYIPEDERPDVVQQAFMHVWTAVRAREEAIDSLEAFVRTLAHRACADWMRKHRRTAEIDPAQPDSAPGPESDYLSKERATIARELVAALSPNCRELIRMFAEDGLNQKEIGEQLGRSHGSIRTAMYKCMKRARELLVARTGDAERTT